MYHGRSWRSTPAHRHAPQTKEDCQLSSHSHYRGLAIGGTLTDSSPQESGTVGGESWVRALSGTALFNWNGGVNYRQGIPFVRVATDSK